jgi:hypothetical protein
MTFTHPIKQALLYIALVLISVVSGIVANTYWFADQHKPSAKASFSALSSPGEDAAAAFMYKWRTSAAYMTVLRFDYAKNSRVPIYRFFNDEEMRKIVLGRLNGGDGALPIFITNDNSNNNQMITIIQGEMTCGPFVDGGLSRVWPDLAKTFTVSCRVPIPPGYGGAIGYIVVHFKQPELRAYEFEAMKIDLMGLAIALNISSAAPR